MMTRLLSSSLALLASLFCLACDQPPPPPPQEEEVPEAYKIMMAQREASREGKAQPAPSTPPPSKEESEDAPDFAQQAEAALVHGKLEDAIKLCDQAQAQGSPCITTHAMAHYLRGDTKKACTHFERAKNLDVLSPELLAIHQVSCIKRSAASSESAREEAKNHETSPREKTLLPRPFDTRPFEKQGTTPLSID